MGCPFFPTANGRTPCSPDSPLTSAGRAGPPGSAAAGCSGWARGAQNGRTCGSLREAEAVARAGVRRGSAEPGAASGRERQVRERLGEHGSLSRGASCGASDLSPTGKASVSALPPPLPPLPPPLRRAARRGGARGSQRGLERPQAEASVPFGGRLVILVPTRDEQRVAQLSRQIGRQQPLSLDSYLLRKMERSRGLSALGKSKLLSSFVENPCLRLPHVPFYDYNYKCCRVGCLITLLPSCLVTFTK